MAQSGERRTARLRLPRLTLPQSAEEVCEQAESVGVHFGAAICHVGLQLTSTQVLKAVARFLRGLRAGLGDSVSWQPLGDPNLAACEAALGHMLP
jgi:hypothetical protein